MRFLDAIFGFGSGYVLDFTNQTFAEFFRDALSVDIYNERYAQIGDSKGKRLKGFLQIEAEALTARALRALWEYREAINGPDVENETRFFALVNAMDGKGGPSRSRAGNAAAQGITPPRRSLDDLSGRLLGLSSLKAQKRGFAFERLLTDLFRVYGLDPRGSFRLVGEQIDGSFELPPETFLLEAKWQDAATGQADLLSFSGKVEGKAQWSRGLFVSYSGFSTDGLQAFARGRPTSIICMDGLDLAHILSGALSLIDVINRKKRRAAETGNAFVPVRTLFTSVT
jgi:hypothetical protein